MHVPPLADRWREYRTLFHVATSYGISEPTASRVVRHVEDCLIRSNLFNLPKDLPEGVKASTGML
ncbi:helix-turn-helix domain-containing protein [Acinetobacter sp. ANC 4169]|uniref:helix-turn-helix domain-containing protein n=1 Tax=Acinetobacter sp. ANC 4169 TaxID=1977879 RepID=UPI00196A7865|nr:transposase family protein [Acinetobacter sp. ANC 4169]